MPVLTPKHEVAEAHRSSNNWKLYMCAVAFLCFLAGIAVGGVSETSHGGSPTTQGLNYMLDGSEAALNSFDEDYVGEIDFARRFKALKSHVDILLQNSTVEVASGPGKGR